VRRSVARRCHRPEAVSPGRLGRARAARPMARLRGRGDRGGIDRGCRRRRVRDRLGRNLGRRPAGRGSPRTGGGPPQPGPGGAAPRGSRAVAGRGAVLVAPAVAARNGDVDRAWVLGLLASLLASPLGWLYYLPFVAGPLLAMARRGDLSPRAWIAWPLLAWP